MNDARMSDNYSQISIISRFRLSTHLYLWQLKIMDIFKSVTDI